MPWELSRFQHLTVLGQAYVLTGDEKYTNEFIAQITDWIDKNKPKFGVNWTCTMDVAIRVCNWIVAYDYFKGSKEIKEDFLVLFLKSLYQHGKHVRSNLEYSEHLTSNHYLSNIAGLVYIGTLFPEFKESAEWRQFGINELIKEMDKQVYDDGCDFEASTCYHRLVLELFFYSTLVVVVNHETFNGNNHKEIAQKVFGEKYVIKLYKMFDAVLYLLKPNGMMPQIGDNDSGRFHVFANRDILDMRYLLTLGAIYFKESRFKIKEFGYCEDAVWIFGKDGYDIWEGLEAVSLTDIESRAFPDSGWYVSRHNNNYMLISCGPNGQNDNGGHCHNDKLSFELCVDGKDVVVDPGTYMYTPEPEWRNLFRSTSYHNTVAIDLQEQSRIKESNYHLFNLENDAVTKVIRWECGTEVDVFIGEHYGYERLSGPVIHQREIRFHKIEGRVQVIDRFFGEGNHTFRWYLTQSPDHHKDIVISSEYLKWKKEAGYYSRQYGEKKGTIKFASEVNSSVPFEAIFWIEG
jgi:hypothetical protein